MIKINLLVHCREQTFKTKTHKEISESSQQNKSGSGGWYYCGWPSEQP